VYFLLLKIEFRRLLSFDAYQNLYQNARLCCPGYDSFRDMIFQISQNGRFGDDGWVSRFFYFSVLHPRRSVSELKLGMNRPVEIRRELTAARWRNPVLRASTQ